MQKAANLFLLFVLSICLLPLTDAFAQVNIQNIEDLNLKNSKTGKYYALVIGISDYKDSALEKIPAAETEAKAFANTLKDKYGFDVTLLTGQNASLSKITKTFEDLSHTVTNKDSLLIFFAGHGMTENLYNYGWWLPVDAIKRNIDSRFSNINLKRFVRDMNVRHVLIISDASFSNTLLDSPRSTPKQMNDNEYLKRFNKNSRWALISGNDAPVKGQKTDGMSAFAYYLDNYLKTNKDPFLSISEIFAKLNSKIRPFSKEPPLCRPLKKFGNDEGGEFIFILSKETLITQKKEANKVTPGVPSKGAAVVPTVKPKAVPKPEPVAIKTGTISIQSNVDNSNVFIDGKMVGVTPILKQTLNEGEHVLRIEKNEYQPYESKFMLTRESNIPFYVELSPLKPKPGKLFVTVIPADANVKLLDGQSPYSPGVSIDPGKYHVEISANGYKTENREIDVETQKDTRLTVQLKPNDFYKNELGMEFKLIPAGSFTMGSPESEEGRDTDEIQHTVELSKPFFMQISEVTVGQWKQFINETKYKTQAEKKDGAYVMANGILEMKSRANWNNPGFDQTEQNPVSCVSYNDIQAFIKWINKKGNQKYSLPTEAQWEYACRAGSNTIFAYGNCLTDLQANFNGELPFANCPISKSIQKTKPVMALLPNAWGLYDMHGNLAEWCQDGFEDYTSAKAVDPVGNPKGKKMVYRGGGWPHQQRVCRSANRFKNKPEYRASFLGFRLVVEQP